MRAKRCRLKRFTDEEVLPSDYYDGLPVSNSSGIGIVVVLWPDPMLPELNKPSCLNLPSLLFNLVYSPSPGFLCCSLVLHPRLTFLFFTRLLPSPPASISFLSFHHFICVRYHAIRLQGFVQYVCEENLCSCCPSKSLLTGHDAPARVESRLLS